MADPITIALLATSAATSIAGGEQARNQANSSSAAERLNARLEQVQAKDDANQIRRDLDNVESTQNALYASRNFVQGHGSALAARTASRTNASRDIDRIRFGAGIRSGNANIRSASLLSEGNSARTAGYARALNTGASLFDKVGD